MIPVLFDHEPEIRKDYYIRNERYSCVLPCVFLISIDEGKGNQQNAMNKFAWYVDQHPHRNRCPVSFIVVEEPTNPHESDDPLRDGGDCEDDRANHATVAVDHVHEVC